MQDIAERKPRFSRPMAFFWLLRLNRTAMVAMITGSAAYAAGAGAARSLWMTLAGWCLAVGGFSLDFYADRDLDEEGPRAEMRHNPLTDGSLTPRSGLIFSWAFIAVSLVLTALIAPWALLPWFAVLAIIVGLALHLFEAPLARALTLGLLQALYTLMGGLAGRLSPGLLLLAGMFFFAMFGGRGMIDIRDYPQDQVTRVQTLPKRYGVQRTARFTALCLLIAYALSFAAYWTGEFNPLYLCLDLVFIAVGLVCAGLFAARPSPKLAYVLTLVFMMGMGTLICLAMILGSVTNEARIYVDATYSALVWEDANGNGKREGGEGPVAGVVVHLVRPSDGAGFANLTTNEEGKVFQFVPAASCASLDIRLVVPQGYEPTTPTLVRKDRCVAEFGIRRRRPTR